MVNLGVERLTIIGTGLLGGSIGLALRRAGFGGELVGTGSRLTTLERARAAGCVGQVTTDLSQAVRGSDLVVLAAPVGAIPELLAQLAKSVGEDTVVTDVGSTKSTIVA